MEENITRDATARRLSVIIPTAPLDQATGVRAGNEAAHTL